MIHDVFASLELILGWRDTDKKNHTCACTLWICSITHMYEKIFLQVWLRLMRNIPVVWILWVNCYFHQQHWNELIICLVISKNGCLWLTKNRRQCRATLYSVQIRFQVVLGVIQTLLLCCYPSACPCVREEPNGLKMPSTGEERGRKGKKGFKVVKVEGSIRVRGTSNTNWKESERRRNTHWLYPAVAKIHFTRAEGSLRVEGRGKKTERERCYDEWWAVC